MHWRDWAGRQAGGEYGPQACPGLRVIAVHDVRPQSRGLVMQGIVLDLTVPPNRIL